MDEINGAVGVWVMNGVVVNVTDSNEVNFGGSWQLSDNTGSSTHGTDAVWNDMYWTRSVAMGEGEDVMVTMVVTSTSVLQ
jgi:hypothetical protein